jgi:uncharacterized protein YcbK (DUF882 family)
LLSNQNSINHIKVSDHFHLDEFQCPCCQLVMLHPLLLQKLTDLRNKIKKPIIITSGYRCQTNNEKVGGVKGSFHLFGMAADIYVSKMDLNELLQSAIEICFPGIGYYPKNNFLHLDVRPVGPVYWQG